MVEFEIFVENFSRNSSHSNISVVNWGMSRPFLTSALSNCDISNVIGHCVMEAKFPSLMFRAFRSVWEVNLCLSLANDFGFTRILLFAMILSSVLKLMYIVLYVYEIVIFCISTITVVLTDIFSNKQECV